MIYGSVCSGIEAATVAWHPLGWRPAFFSEVASFPRAVLRQHYPSVPLHGDFTTIQAGDYEPVDLLVGGTPCQDFSIGGPRHGFGGYRGNLTLEFVRLADRLRPGWIVWENVPGVLSVDGGRAFSAILGGLAELGYNLAYRILDAQFFGLAQQRRRLLLVGCAGGEGAAQVLFEPDCFVRRAGPRPAAAVSVCLTARGAGSLDDRETYIVESSGVRHLTPREFERLQGFPDSYTLIQTRRWRPVEDDEADWLARQGAVLRQQGGKWQTNAAADRPRYAALGNSMPVPVMGWLGRRIMAVQTAGVASLRSEAAQ